MLLQAALGAFLFFTLSQNLVQAREAIFTEQKVTGLAVTITINAEGVWRTKRNGESEHLISGKPRMLSQDGRDRLAIAQVGQTLGVVVDDKVYFISLKNSEVPYVHELHGMNWENLGFNAIHVDGPGSPKGDEFFLLGDDQSSILYAISPDLPILPYHLPQSFITVLNSIQITTTILDGVKDVVGYGLGFSQIVGTAITVRYLDHAQRILDVNKAISDFCRLVILNQPAN